MKSANESTSSPYAGLPPEDKAVFLRQGKLEKVNHLHEALLYLPNTI